MFKFFLKKSLPFFVFLFFIVLISYRLIGDIISIGDWPYFWPFSSYNGCSTWTFSYLGFDRLSAMFGAPVFKSIPRLLSALGFSNYVISYLLNYGLVYICSLVYYLIGKKISGSDVFGYFAGFFIIMNNFTVEHLIVFPGIIFYSLIIYAIAFYTFWLIIDQGLNFRKIGVLIILSVFNVHPFFTINYLLLLFLFAIYYVLNNRKLFKKIFIYFSILFFCAVIIHSYWLVPFIKNMFISSSQSVYGKDIQTAIFNGYKGIASYVNQFNLIHYLGFISKKLHGGPIQYFFNFLLLAFAIFLLIIVKVKDKVADKRYLLFLLIVLLVFFNLALGPKSIITGDVWLYLYNNFSPFGFFRSFTRFIVLYVLSLVFIFSILIKRWEFRYKNIVLLALIVLLFIANSVYFTGNFDGNVAGAKVPQEYFTVNKKYFQNDPQQYNILALPNVNYEGYTWHLPVTRLKKKKSLFQSVYFKEYFFSKPVVYNRSSIQLNLSQNNRLRTLFTFGKKAVFHKDYDSLVRNLNVKYIVIQKDLIDMMKYYSNKFKLIEYKEYIAYFKNNKKYLLKEDNKYFSLYKNKEYMPLIIGQNASFQTLYTTKYRIKIKNLKKKLNLSFLQNYHSQWKLYLEKIPGGDFCKPIKVFHSVHTTECQPNDSFWLTEDLPFVWKKPVFDNTHKKVYMYANGWEIDPQYIRKNFTPGSYKRNKDGSIDIELILYFQPQVLFWIGMIISVVTLLIWLTYLLIFWIKLKNHSHYQPLEN